VFQPIITGADVEVAVRDHIRRWARDYLGEIAFRSGRARGALPVFRSYLPALDLDKFTEDQVPACVIASPGTLVQPVKRRGTYYTTWQVGVGCVVSGQDRDNTFALLPLYAAAVRACMVQHPALGVDFIDGVTWLGERYDELDTNDLRTLAAGSVTFGIDVPSAVDSRGGPTAPSVVPTGGPPVPAGEQPPPADPGEWGTVQEVIITTTSKVDE
jgi:hypothetical protein